MKYQPVKETRLFHSSFYLPNLDDVAKFRAQNDEH